MLGLRRMPRIRPGAWIFRVALNAAKDIQRSAWRRKARPLEAATGREGQKNLAPDVAAEEREDEQRLLRTRFSRGKTLWGTTNGAFYGWRDGAAHQFFGPANATDVWSVKKVNPQSMVHLTEKPHPVLLATRGERARSLWRQRLRLQSQG